MMSNSIETEIESIYEDLLFCEMLNIIFEVHRAVKKGLLKISGFCLFTKASSILKDLIRSNEYFQVIYFSWTVQNLQNLI